MRKGCGFKSYKRSHSGDDGGEDPPVPIPNTEVKLTCARSTCLLRLGDKFADISKKKHSQCGCFSFLNIVR